MQHKLSFKINLILVLNFFCWNTFALEQSIKSDSLKDIMSHWTSPDKEETLDMYLKLSRAYFEEEKNDSSLVYSQLALDIAKALDHKKSLSEAYALLGIVKQYKGQFKDANEYNFKALKVREEINASPTAMASSHGNIALSYQELKQNEKAIEHQKIALQYSIEANDSANIALRNNMLGASLYQAKKYDEAKFYYDQAYEINKVSGDIEQLPIYHIYIGLIHMKKDRLQEAKTSFLEALNTYQGKEKRMKVFIYANLAVNYLIIGAERDSIGKHSLKKSIYYAEKTYNLASEISFLAQTQKATEILYKAYDALGAHKKAMVYAKEYILLNDSIYNKNQQKAITEIQTKYETEKKEVEIEFLNKENKIKSENLKQAEELQKNQLLFIIILTATTILTILLLVWIYKIYLDKKKSNIALEAKNKVIVAQKEEKEILLKEIHHRVKNNLQLVSSLLDLQTKNIADASTLSAIEDGQTRVKAMALIHQKLYQNEDITHIDFNDYVRQLVNQIAAIHSNGNQVKRTITGPSLSLDIDTAIPLGLILNELVSNAYKYAFKRDTEGLLAIQLIAGKDGAYYVSVRDNGPGMPPHFDISKAKSLGLRLVRRLSKQLYGTSSYKNENGAIFTVSFKTTETRKAID